MKTRVFWKWRTGLALLVLPLAAGCLQEATSSPETATPLNNPESQSGSNAEPTAEEVADVAEPVGGTSDAPVRAVSAESPLPPNVKSTVAMAEVIKLAQSGVDEGVMLAFVTNSTSTFNLGSDEVVYLNDLGIPSNVIAGMIQRDQTLKEELTSLAAPMPAEPPQPQASYPPASSAPLQIPQEVAQVDFPTENYLAPQPADAADANFYDSLAPYGAWVDVDGYGRCWQPTVARANAGWQPYFDSGRWVYSDCGWYWMSDYSWGWAPFHYGRWFRHNRRGWCWAPDTVWGPSWVCWRYTDNYCGWAPLPPAVRFTSGIGLTFNGMRVNPFSGFGLAANCFPFVPLRNLCDHNPRRHAVAASQVAAFYNQTVAFAGVVPHNHTVFNHGIAPERVGAAGRTQIRTVALHDAAPPPNAGFREHFEAHNTALATFRLHSFQPRANHLASTANSRMQSRADSSPSTPPPVTPRQAVSLPAASGQSTADSGPNSSKHFVIRGEHWAGASHGISAQHTLSAQAPGPPEEQTGASAPRGPTLSRSQWPSQQAGEMALNDRQKPADHREAGRTHAEQFSRYEAAPVAGNPHPLAPPAHPSSFEALRLSSASGTPAQQHPRPMPVAGHHETQPVPADGQSDASPPQFSAPADHSSFGVSRHQAALAVASEHDQPAAPVAQHEAPVAAAAEAHSSHSAPAAAAQSSAPSRGSSHSSSDRRSR